MTLQFPNRVRTMRLSHGLTQVRLAELCGVSRSVTAVESQRTAPSVTMAIALAKALNTSVEKLFSTAPDAQPPRWAWDPPADSSSYWQAEVDGCRWRYPAESTPMLSLLPDRLSSSVQQALDGSYQTAQQTLVLASCDPAAGILASYFQQATRLRMLVVSRSSRQAIELLRQGKVHVAGLHLATADQPQANREAVADCVGRGYQLIQAARWEEGIATQPANRIRSVRSALQSRMSWVGREPGSGARQCLDRLSQARVKPRRLARDHRGVAEALRNGWAELGVCLH